MGYSFHQLILQERKPAAATSWAILFINSYCKRGNLLLPHYGLFFSTTRIARGNLPHHRLFFSTTHIAREETCCCHIMGYYFHQLILQERKPAAATSWAILFINSYCKRGNQLLPHHGLFFSTTRIAREETCCCHIMGLLHQATASCF